MDEVTPDSAGITFNQIGFSWTTRLASPQKALAHLPPSFCLRLAETLAT